MGERNGRRGGRRRGDGRKRQERKRKKEIGRDGVIHDVWLLAECLTLCSRSYMVALDQRYRGRERENKIERRKKDTRGREKEREK